MVCLISLLLLLSLGDARTVLRLPFKYSGYKRSQTATYISDHSMIIFTMQPVSLIACAQNYFKCPGFIYWIITKLWQYIKIIIKMDSKFWKPEFLPPNKSSQRQRYHVLSFQTWIMLLQTVIWLRLGIQSWMWDCTLNMGMVHYGFACRKVRSAPSPPIPA